MSSQQEESVAICLLHSYRNPAHELLIADLLRREYPMFAVSASVEVSPEIREFDRSMTTVCNAFVLPLVDRYIERLEVDLRLKGFRGRLYLMQSDGGLTSPDLARRFPIRLLESGPAGGATIAAHLCRILGLGDILSLEMGGTTAKSCVISDGRPELANSIEVARVHRFRPGSGFTITTPVVDLVEIGAGGGSIANIDELGLLKVGPLSAGADPGPACYGRGGENATVTDACVALGYLDPTNFLGGHMALDHEASNRVLDRLAAEMMMDPVDAAWGVYLVACENLAAATRVYMVERGRDPRKLPLIALGGAGPLHAALVARLLGVSRVIVPRIAAVASALGFLVAPVSFGFSRSLPQELRAVDWEEVSRLYSEMELVGREAIESAGLSPSSAIFARHVDMRLAGQFHDLTVGVPNGSLDSTCASTLLSAFAVRYQSMYRTEVLAGYEPLALTWRLRVSEARSVGPAWEFPENDGDNKKDVAGRGIHGNAPHSLEVKGDGLTPRSYPGQP